MARLVDKVHDDESGFRVRAKGYKHAAGEEIATHDVHLIIDGANHHVSVDPRESLWETLTYQLDQPVANMGCDRMQCGACDVVIDGRIVNSCGLLTARLSERQIETIASLRSGEGIAGLHPLQRAFWAEGTLQCGICTKGFIMAAYALLRSTPEPTDEEIERGLAGVLCRCGEHGRVLTAVKRAAKELLHGSRDTEGSFIRESLMPHTSDVLGRAIPRIHGMGSVTEDGSYVSLMTLRDMLFVRTLRSPYPRARIVKIDVGEALRIPGVVDILHYFNLPPEYREVVIEGPPPRHLLNEQLVQIGMPVAVVAATSEHVADDALNRIVVEYDVQEPVLDFRETADTPQQWDNEFDGTIRTTLAPVIVGNPNRALAAAPIRIEQTTSTPYQQHVPVELRTGVYVWEGETLVTYQTTHEPFVVQRRLATWLGIPPHQVKVVQTGFMGSSYGSSDHIVEELALPAIMAKLTRRPVRSMLTREENFLTSTHRGRTQTRVNIGVSARGKLEATSVEVLFDCGANAGATDAGGTPGARGAWYVFQTLYDFPNQRYEGTEVFTNNLRSGSMRGVGRNFGMFALETALEKAAYASRRDPLAFRLDNLNETGTAFDEGTGTNPGRPFARPEGQRECLVKAAEMIQWQDLWHPPGSREVRPGVFHGMAIVSALDRGGGYLGGTGAHATPPSTGQVMVHADGRLEVLSGSADQGAGQRTLMAMIAAQTLGIPLDEVDIAPGVDTVINTDTGPTLSSLQTNLGGWGVLEAAKHAKSQLLAWAGPRFEREFGIDVEPDALEVRNGWVHTVVNERVGMTVSELTAGLKEPIVGLGKHKTEVQSEPVSKGAHAAEIEIDIATGGIEVTRYVAVHDVGRILNRLGLKQQVEGGIVFGLGTTLYEELITDFATGLPVNPNILDYKPPTFPDAPPMEVDFVEVPQDYGPYGAIAIGQASTPPVAPVVANAVYNAVGIWLHELPFSRKRVFSVLREGWLG